MVDMTDAKTRIEHFLKSRALPGVDVITDELKMNDIPKQLAVITHDSLRLIGSSKTVDWIQFDQLRTHYEQGAAASYNEYLAGMLDGTDSQEFPSPRSRKSVVVKFSYNREPQKYSVNDFVSYFNRRYDLIEKMLRPRPELQSTISISRVLKKREREHVSVIGMISGKTETRNGNILITLEDPTGTISALVSKNKPDIFKQANDLVLDETVGVTGVCGNKIIFVNNIIWPDIPIHTEMKKAPDEAYAIFLSDTHIGSKNFLESAFKKFLKWIIGDTGTKEQKMIARKVKYVFIAGDLVDGVGIYPNQDKELTIKDIYGQYAELSRLLSFIPPHINIIVSPGNHDALRMSEPQPALDNDFAAPLHSLSNVTVVSNPGIVNIHSSDNFTGFDVLLYHGYSFDYYVSNVDSIRNKGGYRRSDLIMRFLLKRRHLAPSHTSTLYVPDSDDDSLVIKKVPDFFATGHIHYSLVANYRSVTMISGSCWQGMTSFQEKLGHNPEPARVPLINLKTRAIKILYFN
jgi:DNA polymerase II small subunit